MYFGNISNFHIYAYSLDARGTQTAYIVVQTDTKRDIQIRVLINSCRTASATRPTIFSRFSADPNLSKQTLHLRPCHLICHRRQMPARHASDAKNSLDMKPTNFINRTDSGSVNLIFSRPASPWACSKH